VNASAHPIALVLQFGLYGCVAAWLLFRSLRRSENQALLILKWILTVLVGLLLVKEAAPMADPHSKGLAAYDGIVLAALCGVALVVLWGRSIPAALARPIESLFTGGDREPEAAPSYSIARAKRKRGQYAEALAEIRSQLARFPTDIEGQLLLAELQAEDLNDLQGAEVTIHRLCNQKGHPPGSVAHALNTLADWHLKYAQDRDAARLDLEKIIALSPDSQLSALAAQRIAHLADTAFLLAAHDPGAIRVPVMTEDLGLKTGPVRPVPRDTAPQDAAAAYVRHLEEHPLDTEAREKLAVLYADHYQRLDLAADQLEQLITHRGQPASRIVRWLNLLADLQIRLSGDYDTVRKTLQRIIDLYPDTAAAHLARTRMEYLKLELKGREKTSTVPIGNYEQDIGLKKKLES